MAATRLAGLQPCNSNMTLMIRILFALTLFLSSSVAMADALWPDKPSIKAKSWVLLDANSGQVLFTENADVELPPASLTKMMTLYLVFDEVKSGRLNLNERLPVSKKAWKIGGSTMFLEPRMTPRVQEVMHGIATLSGNDACIVMAEHLAGSEDAFAERMNKKAKELGMLHTHFVNSTGFPADGHYSSAHDMALLGAALWRDFPKYYAMFSEREYSFDGRTQGNRNRLLWSMPEADGIKTGHTEAAGYCLVGSAVRGKMRLVSAVFGAKSDASRARQSKMLLGYGLRHFRSLRPAERQLRRKIELFHGKDDHVWLSPAHPVWVTVPKGMETKVSFRLSYDSPASAPVTKGQVIGSIEGVLRTGDKKKVLSRVAMIAVRDVEQASWLGHQWDELRLWWQQREQADQAEETVTP